MIQTINNAILSVSIDAIGAELSSIKTIKDNKEFLWQGDPSIWASQAPVLFPIVGGLKNGEYQYQGKIYALPKHGFIRYNKNIQVTQKSDTKVTFSLSSSGETLKMYPFDFTFKISYELHGSKIIIAHQIINTGKETMFFSVGGHPAFNCPIDPSEKYEEYYIQLQNSENPACYLLNDGGLISDKTTSVIQDHKIALNSTIFDNDALIFKNIQAQKATLIHQKNGPVLSVEFKDFPDLGIWAKPKAHFVCVEPWLGYADVDTTNQNIEEKEGIRSLKPGNIHKSSYTLTLELMPKKDQIKTE